MTDVSRDRSEPPRTLILVTADLFLGSRLRAMAEQAGDRVVTVANPARLANARSGSGIKRYAIDLSMPAINCVEWHEHLSESERSQALAYAPPHGPY